MRASMFFAALVFLALASGNFVACARADEATPTPTTGSVTIFPGSLEEAAPPDFNDMPKERGWHIDGAYYRADAAWRVLACLDPRHCAIHTLRMNVLSLAIQPHNDDAEPAQFLTWQPLPPGQPLLFFKQTDTRAPRIGFTPGPVPTFLCPAMPQEKPSPAPARVGSMATRIAWDDHVALLVPRLSKSTGANAGDEVWIELRVDGKRQRLDTYTFSQDWPRAIDAHDYLVWAGDLDGDGKLDLLMNGSDDGVAQSLYLSSLAGPGEIVGAAGSIAYWPPQMGD